MTMMERIVYTHPTQQSKRYSQIFSISISHQTNGQLERNTTRIGYIEELDLYDLLEMDAEGEVGDLDDSTQVF